MVWTEVLTHLFIDRSDRPHRPFLLFAVRCTENVPQIVKGFKDGEFAAIIHDPPARALCKTTDMYGASFYKDLARVLKPGGTLFHYIGNPESK